MPLSPILFDMCLNLLIEKLNSPECKKLCFSWDTDDYLIAQAYTDDILLFSDSYEHMMDLVGIVNDLNYESNIQLNPKKWKW
jgi:hypothetical protein